MTANARSVRALSSVPLALLAACSAHRMAGSTGVAPQQPIVLRVRAPEPIDVRVQLWNRGPADVRFEQSQPGSDAFATGVLVAGGPEFTWEATTAHLELVLTTAEGDATIAYTVRSESGLDVYAGPR